MALGTVFNAIGNYLLGFGHLGLPALGLAGIAWATVASHWLMLLSLVLYTQKHPQLKTYRLLQRLFHVEPSILGELLWIGTPIGVSFALEVGLFSVTTYLMGILGTPVLAAHQIVLQTITIVFMVPVGMSFVSTIRVGQWLGQKNPEGIRRSGFVNMGLGSGFMVVMAIVLFVFSKSIISLYLDVQNPENAPVIALATAMLKVAALAQILDGVQTTAAGALRGLQDTRIPMLLSFIAFWVVGLLCGYLLGFRLGFGGVGLWLGQSVGVAIAAIVFVSRFYYLLAKKFA